jgi:hypothetical protein
MHSLDAYLIAAHFFRALAVLLVLGLIILAVCRTGAHLATPTRSGGTMAGSVGSGNDVSRDLQSKDGRTLRASAPSGAGVNL